MRNCKNKFQFLKQWRQALNLVAQKLLWGKDFLNIKDESWSQLKRNFQNVSWDNAIFHKFYMDCKTLRVNILWIHLTLKTIADISSSTTEMNNASNTCCKKDYDCSISNRVKGIFIALITIKNVIIDQAVRKKEQLTQIMNSEIDASSS